MEHLISNIQRFSVDDGPGIRTTVFMMGCPLSCIWCHNPECITGKRKLFNDSLKCAHCGRCIGTCKNGALSVKDGDIEVDREKCTGCLTCVSACPTGAMSVTGREYTKEELIDTLMQDEPFFRKSGGGVTFSGGEPLLHTDYLLPVIKDLKERGISIIFETCGHVPYGRIREVLPYTDAFLFDIKGMDKEKHMENTGASNEIILENLIKLSRDGVRIFVRMPVIKGANADADEIKKAAELIASLDNIAEADILPYHAYGTLKYARYGIKMCHRELVAPDTEELISYRNILEEHGIRAVIKNL